MNRKNPNRSTHATFAPLSSAILGLTLGLCASAQALAGSHTSVADAAWLWDPSDIVGESKLVRTENGISATYRRRRGHHVVHRVQQSRRLRGSLRCP
jgi:hypothetical protein